MEGTMTGPAEKRQISLDDVDRVLRLVIRVSRRWTALVLVVAVLSAFTVSVKASSVEWAVQITPITVLLISLIWLPALVNVIALAGGGLKTPAGEATAGGLFELLRSLEPAAQRGALPAVIAALDTGPTKNDPGVARLRRQLQGELAGMPVDAADARSRLMSLAREYEVVRKTMPSGPDRTFKMTQIVTEARGLTRAAQLDPQSLTGLFQGPGDGDRVITLALIQARPDPTHVPIVIDAIQNARSPFEQYHGLIAGLNLVDSLSGDARESLRQAVIDRTNPRAKGVLIDLRDPERFRLAQQLLDALKA
jgi:hypothetical protein